MIVEVSNLRDHRGPELILGDLRKIGVVRLQFDGQLAWHPVMVKLVESGRLQPLVPRG